MKKKKQEEWEMKVKEIKNRTLLLSSLLDPESPYAKDLLDVMLQLAKMDIDSETLDGLNDFLTALKHPKFKEAVVLFFASLLPIDIGTKYLTNPTDKQEQYMNSIHKALIDSEYIKEEIDNG